MNGPLQRGNVCPVLEASPAPAHLWLHEDSWGVDREGRERGTPFMGPLVSGCPGGSPEEHPYEDAGVRVMEISAVSYGVSGLMPDGSGVLIVCHLLAHFSIHSLNPRFSGLHAGLAQCWVLGRCCEGNSLVAHGRKSSVVLGVQQSMVQGYREMAMSCLGF